jgi:FkbM family methyltransferase
MTLKSIIAHPLNKGKSKGELLSKYICWQIGSRLVPGAVAVPFVNHTRLLVRPGLHGITGNIYVGLNEFEEMSFLLHMLRQGDRFLDVGANAGVYSVLAAGAVGARCISIEPVPSSYNNLLDNLRINNLSDSVQALNIGAGSERGSLYFTTNADTRNRVILAGGQHDLLAVTVDTIDNICQGRNFIPDMIKIDVEGFEGNVIAGAKNTLNNSALKCVLMEVFEKVNPYGFHGIKVHREMLEYGFESFLYLPFERRLVSLNRALNPSGNTLYIREKDLVNTRIMTAPEFAVHGRSI